MHENHEEWIDSFAGIIPNQHYTSRVELGDEIGLIVRLSGDAYNVVLNFGIPTAVNFLDEGVQLNDVQRMSLYTELLPLNKFESVIYRIKNGRYARYIEECMGSILFQMLGLRQYNIVTLNNVVMIVSQCDPEITVVEINT